MLYSDFINKKYLQKGGDILRVLEVRKIEKDNLAFKKGIKLIHILEEDWKK